MKKILFAIPCLAMALVACDPAVDEVSPSAPITAEELTSNFELVAKSAGNNNITVQLKESRYVKVYDAETGEVAAEGTNPVVQVLPPARTVNYYLTTMNGDGSIVKSSTKSIDVAEFTDLPAIYNDVFGDGAGGFTTRTWVWNTEASDGVWGNGAYLQNTGPGWWVVSAADIDTQASEKGYPMDGLDGWMEISLTGVNTSRGEQGSVKVTNNSIKEGWAIGTMTFGGTIPLLGVQTNLGNQPQYEYHILKATQNELRLCAPEPGAGEWGTAWFWNFKTK